MKPVKTKDDEDAERSYDAEPEILVVASEEAAVRATRRERERAYPERPGR